MPTPQSTQASDAFELALRVMLGIAATVLLAGWALFLAQHGSEPFGFREFHENPPEGSVLSRVARGVGALDGASVMLLGIVLLVATPAARVAVTLVTFARQHDRLFTVLSGVVLLILAYGLFLSR